MIKYDLKCENSHVFEAWFKNSATYDEQAMAGDIICAVCGSTKTVKAPMAPAVARKGSRNEVRRETIARQQTEQAAMAVTALRELRKQIEDNCSYVGPRFAEEARKIHYGEVEQHGIYGEATPDERQELREEGVEIAEIPWLPTTDA
ncbi:MAG: hypothetical protein CMN55_04945 [Sneathiella sp.]|jgi:hypothetical protein|uniref:DUF1178 family protein n=1 Tax=Sneathiella sp. TaxID=1964365 RepID=UPI000C5BE53A|nr:DUF1178 family protein [Sneathiella sp.]MAL78446.1 hypothetical protein [Sneathiella sp.]